MKTFFFAYITNQIASKKVKPRRTGGSDKKKIQKLIDKNVRWWAPGYPVVLRVNGSLQSFGSGGMITFIEQWRFGISKFKMTDPIWRM